MLKRKQSEIRFPLEQKLLLVVIPLIALSLMAVSVITYRVAKQNIQNRVSEYMEQYLLQLSSAIDNKLETSIQLNAQLSVNAQLSEILQEYHSAPSDEKLNYRQDVENIFVTIMSIYDNIRSIYVFDNYGNEFYLRNRSGIGLELLEQESWYQDALARQGAYVIFLDRHGGEENTTIGIARSIVNIYTAWRLLRSPTAFWLRRSMAATARAICSRARSSSATSRATGSTPPSRTIPTVIWARTRSRPQERRRRGCLRRTARRSSA